MHRPCDSWLSIKEKGEVTVVQKWISTCNNNNCLSKEAKVAVDDGPAPLFSKRKRWIGLLNCSSDFASQKSKFQVIGWKHKHKNNDGNPVGVRLKSGSNKNRKFSVKSKPLVLFLNLKLIGLKPDPSGSGSALQMIEISFKWVDYRFSICIYFHFLNNYIIIIFYF